MKNILISKFGAFLLSASVLMIAQVFAGGITYLNSASSMTAGLATIGFGSMLRGIFNLIILALIAEVFILLAIDKEWR